MNINYKNYEGIDANNKISLFEYGFLCAYNKKDDDYHIIYRVGDEFSTGWISEKELNELMTEDSWVDTDDILKYVGTTLDKWLEMSFINKFSDLLGYYGCQNLMGDSMDTFEVDSDNY